MGLGRGQEIARRHAPEKLIYPLEHAYTPAELGFATLKGADAAVAAVLIAAARRSESDLHLALLTVEESGIAEYTGHGPSRGRWSERNCKRARSTSAVSAFPNGGGSMAARRCWSSCRSKTKNSRRPMPSARWTLTKSASTKRPATKGLFRAQLSPRGFRALAA